MMRGGLAKVRGKEEEFEKESCLRREVVRIE